MWYDVSTSGPVTGAKEPAKPWQKHHCPQATIAEVEHSGEHGAVSAELLLKTSSDAWRREKQRCWVVREFNGREGSWGVPVVEDVAWDWIWDDAAEQWIEPAAETKAASHSKSSCNGMTHEVRESLAVLLLLLGWYAASLVLLVAVAGS